MNDNSLPLISIIVPVYKVEKYLTRCVESILRQTYKNFELILVDDGSPDNCPSMCDDFAEKDCRIKVVHKENGGLSDARNFGLDRSSGEYITFVDSDDYIRNDMIEVLYNRIAGDASDLAICNYLCVGDGGAEYKWENSNLPVKDVVLSSEEAQKALYGYKNWHFVIACCKLYSKFLFDGFRFPVNKLHEDLHTTHLIFDRCNKISCVSDALYFYYQNENSITHVYNVKRLDILDAYISRFDFYYNKGDYYCAIMNLDFMINKILIAYSHFHKDNNICLRLKTYKKTYKKNLKKVIFKNIEGVNKKKLIIFYFDTYPYILYRALKQKSIKELVKKLLLKIRNKK